MRGSHTLWLGDGVSTSAAWSGHRASLLHRVRGIGTDADDNGAVDRLPPRQPCRGIGGEQRAAVPARCWGCSDCRTIV